MAPLSLSCQDLIASQDNRPILHEVSLTLPPNRLCGIIGPNGAGKSTLLKSLAGLLTPSAGQVTLNGQNLYDLPSKERAQNIGYMAQDTTSQWPLTVRALVTLGRYPYRRMMRQLNAEDHAAITKALEDCALHPLAERSILTLSGGERARAMLARVLAGTPSILLADEPTADLDPRHQIEVMTTLKQRATTGQTIALVLHDLNLAARFCDDLLLLKDGKILAFGPSAQVLKPDLLEQAYGIKVFTATHEDTPYIIPWGVTD